MPETVSRTSRTASTGCQAPAPAPGARPRVPSPSPYPRRFRSRIGVGAAGGFYPAPRRYDLFLCGSCPRSLRISITLDLLGLRDSVGTTLLASPTATPDGYAALRRAYETTGYHYDGPLTAPALRDRWSGRIVSNHTSDILRDLAGPLAGEGGAGPAALRPPHLTADIEALRTLLDRDVTPAAQPSARRAALGRLDRRLARRPYALGDELTASDVDLWVALVHLDEPAELLGAPRLGEYVRRLGEHPAFRSAIQAPAGHAPATGRSAGVMA
ncbi:glutathione S-transferase C-terminal domain-containing protein [Streptomyces xanthochromogenes]|uniref:glutathione S-transferase C-terminal domain-containing protein n=1 Tax=Streptomyces xanthochromogenes TaxID=67384 RepID=UPI002F403931